MRYFDYQNNAEMGRVWGLFSGLANLTKNDKMGVNRTVEYGHTIEIIKSALNNNFALDEEFSLAHYERTCIKHDGYGINSSGTTMLAIVDSINGEDERVNYGEISCNQLPSKEDPYRELEDKDEFERCLKQLCDLRGLYQIQLGIDPVETLKNSLKGVPEAVTSLVTLISEDIQLKEIISFLCENGSNILQERLEGILI